MIGDPLVTDAIEIWTERGYTEEYVLGMWNSIYNQYLALCEDKWLDMAVLGGQAFPCINSGGVYAYTEGNNFTKKMIKPGCAINSTALTSSGGTPVFVTGDKVGFQINYDMYAHNNATPIDYQACLNHGILKGAKWLECYDYNITGPGNYKLIIESTNQKMTA
jgi:hypothetical protein